MVRITAINSTFFQQTSNALSFRPLPLSLRQILPADSHYGKHLQSFSTSLMKTEGEWNLQNLLYFNLS